MPRIIELLTGGACKHIVDVVVSEAGFKLNSLIARSCTDCEHGL